MFLLVKMKIKSLSIGLLVVFLCGCFDSVDVNQSVDGIYEGELSGGFLIVNAGKYSHYFIKDTGELFSYSADYSCNMEELENKQSQVVCSFARFYSLEASRDGDLHEERYSVYMELFMNQSGQHQFCYVTGSDDMNCFEKKRNIPTKTQ
jgi:hypothetical protein